MNSAAFQSRGETSDAKVFLPKYDVTNRGVVRQHADDDISVEEVCDFRRGLKAERREFIHLIWATDVCNHPMSGGGKVCGHRLPHVTETDKANAPEPRQAAGRTSTSRFIDGTGLRCSRQS
jgi:hypothetical protein